MLRAQRLHRFEIVIFYHSLLADWMLLNDTKVSPFNREFPGPEAELHPTENDQKTENLGLEIQDDWYIYRNTYGYIKLAYKKYKGIIKRTYSVGIYLCLFFTSGMHLSLLFKVRKQQKCHKIYPAS